MIINKYKLILFTEKLYILIVFLSLFYGPFVGGLLGIDALRLILFLLSFIILGVRFFISSKFAVDKEVFVYSMLSLLLLVFSIQFWMSTYSINSYLGLIVAFFVFAFNEQTHYFYKLIKITIYIVLIIAIYEYIIKDYIYVEEVMINGKKVVMDAHLFGGKNNVFRAKAIFPGPLTLAQFATGVGFIFYKNTRILLLMFLLCFLANARLGILVIMGIILIKFSPRILSLRFHKYFFILLFLTLIGGIIAFYLYVDAQTIDRLLTTFDTENKGNSKRMDYWINGITEWWNYGIQHKIFGNNGFFRSLYDNNAENGWITLLLENGILGFLYYSLPLFIISIYSIIKKTTHIFLVVLILFSMFVQTYYMGGVTNLLFWIIIFIYYRELKDKKYEAKV